MNSGPQLFGCLCFLMLLSTGTAGTDSLFGIRTDNSSYPYLSHRDSVASAKAVCADGRLSIQVHWREYKPKPSTFPDPELLGLLSFVRLKTGGKSVDTWLAGWDYTDQSWPERSPKAYSVDWDEDGRAFRLKGKGDVFRKEADDSEAEHECKGYIVGSSIRIVTGKTRVITEEGKPLTAALKRRLGRLGLGKAELSCLRFVRLTDGLKRDTTILCLREDILLILGTDCGDTQQVISFGPILGVESAHIDFPVASDRWLLLDDESFPRSKVDAAAIYVSSNVCLEQAELGSKPKIIQTDPVAWIQELLRTRNIREVAAVMESHLDPGKAEKWKIATTLGAELPRGKLRDLAAEHPELQGMKAIAVEGEKYGVDGGDLVNDDPKTVVILRRGFSNHGGVFSAGPIIALGGNKVAEFISSKWIEGVGADCSGRGVCLEGSPGKPGNRLPPGCFAPRKGGPGRITIECGAEGMKVNGKLVEGSEGNPTSVEILPQGIKIRIEEDDRENDRE